MARKTKAEKIASEERVENQTFSLKAQYSLPNTKSFSTPQSNSVAVDASNYSYVVSDLKKIGVFTLLAFGAEILLWYFLR